MQVGKKNLQPFSKGLRIAILLFAICHLPAYAQVDASFVNGGAVRVGTSTTTCDSTTTGAIRYNSTSSRVEFCDSSDWIGFGSTAGIDDLDDGYTDYSTDHNISIGSRAPAIGFPSGSQYNVMVGQGAGRSLTSGSRNTGFGYAALRATTTGSDNTAFGYAALRGAITGNGNVSFGGFSLVNADSASYNVALGKQPLNNSTGSYNVAVGYAPMPNHGDNNVAIGRETLDSGSTNGNGTAVGYYALAVASGGNNIAFGYQAGNALTTGANDIIIGYDIDAPAVSSSNFLSIGNLIFATGLDGTGTTISSGAVGIGISNPANKFVVQAPSAETIVAAATITANACGTIKKITSAGGVTTNTTNTFTSPTSGYDGCCMDVFNSGANTITLDQNAKFKTSGGANVSLTSGSFVRVCSNGTNWYQLTAVVTPS